MFQDILGHDLPPFFWANRIGAPSLQDEPFHIQGKPQIVYRCKKCDATMMCDHQSNSNSD